MAIYKFNPRSRVNIVLLAGLSFVAVALTEYSLARDSLPMVAVAAFLFGGLADLYLIGRYRPRLLLVIGPVMAVTMVLALLAIWSKPTGFQQIQLRMPKTATCVSICTLLGGWGIITAFAITSKEPSSKPASGDSVQKPPEHDHGRCPWCNYDLKGILPTARCPECGKYFHAEQNETYELEYPRPGVLRHLRHAFDRLLRKGR